MLKILFGTVVFLIAATPWAFLLYSGGVGGGTAELENQVSQYKQEVLVEKQKTARLDEQVVEFEEDVQAYHSKLEFFEESIVKTEDRLRDAVTDRDAVNDQLKEMRTELGDVEERLLAETNRANTFEGVNDDVAKRLDRSIQEVRRLQTIIRTLSKS